MADRTADYEDLRFAQLHHAVIDGPDLIVDGQRYESFYAAHDAWAALAVAAPDWIVELLAKRWPARTRSEWRLRCDDCPLDSISTRKPRQTSFHWSIDGKCQTKPHLSHRRVTQWEPMDMD